MTGICSMCERKLGSVYMKPSKCAQKYGFSKCHRVCEKCWFGRFALENKNHQCPGCLKKMKLSPKERRKASEVIVVNLLNDD